MKAEIKSFFQALSLFIAVTWARISYWLMPTTEWKFIGTEEVLYRREVQRAGLTLVGELKVDYETVRRQLGVFGDSWRFNCLPASSYGFFYPAKTAQSHYDDLREQGFADKVAWAMANRRVEEAMKDAESFGEDWYQYTMQVKALDGNVVLAVSEVTGVEAEVHPLRMDPEIDLLFEQLAIEADSVARQRLAKARPRLMLDA